MGRDFARFVFICLFILLDLTFAQKTPVSKEFLWGFPKLFDQWYQDSSGTLTLKTTIRTDEWRVVNSLTDPLDAQSYFFAFRPFAVFTPYYLLDASFSFKAVPFLTIIFSTTLMPDTRNRAAPLSVYDYNLDAASSAFQIGFRSYQGELRFDIGPGDLALNVLFKNRTDNVSQYLTTYANTFTTRDGVVFRVLGWPFDPNYNRDERDLNRSAAEYRAQTFSVSLRNSKPLRVEPTFGLSFTYVELALTNNLNGNEDSFSTGNQDLGRGDTYIVQKMVPTLDGKLLFRPVDELTTTIGGTFTPSFHGYDKDSYQSYMQTLSVSTESTLSLFLNIDIKPTRRLLIQTGFKYTLVEHRFKSKFQTPRWLDVLEQQGYVGKFQNNDYDAGTSEIFITAVIK